jgi:LmbE family N-acetylglucosaminyl deacetylase
VSGNTKVHQQRHAKSRVCGIHSPATWLALTAGVTPTTLRPAFLFAHADDAAFSAFFALVETGAQALDVIVCAGLPPVAMPGCWDKQCGFSSAAQARQHRLREHRTLCRHLGIRSIALDVRDGQYGTAASDYLQATGPCADAIRRAGANIILTHCRWPDHPDHRRVVGLARKVGERLAIPVAFTCDRPYFCCSATCCEVIRDEQPAGQMWSVALPEDIWRQKAAAVQFYASQHSALASAFGPSWSGVRRLGRECYGTLSKAIPRNREDNDPSEPQRDTRRP